MNRSWIARRTLLVACLTFAAIGLGGCRQATHTLTAADSGSLVIVDRGDVIAIRLSGNVSTGYLWERTAPDALVGAPLSPLDEGEYESLGSAPGSPGLFVFRYAAVESGTVTLRFVHHRTWEDEPPLGEVAFVVWVQ
jgi:predicted secreted protein